MSYSCTKLPPFNTTTIFHWLYLRTSGRAYKRCYENVFFYWKKIGPKKWASQDPKLSADCITTDTSSRASMICSVDFCLRQARAFEAGSWGQESFWARARLFLRTWPSRDIDQKQSLVPLCVIALSNSPEAKKVTIIGLFTLLGLLCIEVSYEIMLCRGIISHLDFLNLEMQSLGHLPSLR